MRRDFIESFVNFPGQPCRSCGEGLGVGGRRQNPQQRPPWGPTESPTPGAPQAPPREERGGEPSSSISVEDLFPVGKNVLRGGYSLYDPRHGVYIDVFPAAPCKTIMAPFDFEAESSI
jgi:hypothetical protein